MTIYFAASGGRIKIGITENVPRRLAYINTHLEQPLTLIGTISGGRKAEKAIHDHLQDHRLNGEWFKDCDEVRRKIRNFILADKNISPEVKKDVPKPYQERTRTKEEYCEMFANLVRLIWPNDALRELSKFSEQPESECLKWLNGEEVPPRLVRMAFASVVVQYAMSDCPRRDSPKRSYRVASERVE